MRTRDKYLAFGTPDYTEAEIEAVSRVMRSGWVGMGEETLAFEDELASYIGCPYVVTVDSCTSALFLSLLVAGIGKDDEVIVPSLTWCATANAALYLGAIPVFCDVDPYHMCATAETILEKVTDRTKAVIVVHYGGYAIDIEELRGRLPDQVVIIEDAAHAMGALYPSGKRVGTSGNLVCFSFYANKNLSTAEGGAIALFDAMKAARIRKLRMNGMESTAWLRYINPKSAFISEIDELGYKMNYTDLQAAIGRVQLSRLDDMAVLRLNLVEQYLTNLNKELPEIRFQRGVLNAGHSRHLLAGYFGNVLNGMSRNELLLALRKQKIGASIHYQPLHTMSLYLPYLRGELPVTTRLGSEIMSLPIGARMKTSDVEYVTFHLTKLLKG